MLKDVRFALRTLRRSPSFTLVVMTTLGLGIGINTAIFSLVNGVLLRPLPYDQPERVMTLWEANPQLDIPQDRVAAGTYRDWTERAELVDLTSHLEFLTSNRSASFKKQCAARVFKLMRNYGYSI